MLILVRHGQTAANAEGRLLGRSDPPLTELGRQQAAAVADAVGRPSRVISSPLERARETAGQFGVEVEIDDRWIEVDYGELEGVPVGEVDPELWREWRADPRWAPPGGESFTAVARRVSAACEELAPAVVDADIVVVSHVSPIKAAVAWALGVGAEIAWRMFLDVAAVSRIAVSDRGPTLRSWNERIQLPIASAP